jgi:hypothetical protein
MTMPTQFASDHFQYGVESVLGAVYRGAAEVGEVLATTARIDDGDADSWLREWTATAGASWAAAGTAAEHGHRATARAHYLRAGTYYGAALSLIAYTDGSVAQLDLWRRQRDCWDHAVALFPVPAEHVEIPYLGTSLPGYFFRAPGAKRGESRPLVVMSNGNDLDTSQMWLKGGAAASERGYHWMTFDGPGQQSALYEQGLLLRPDWEAVLTPVTDAMLARPDVDGARLAVMGMAQAGFWVPRALAFEHRYAAAVVDPGIVDVSTVWTDALTPELLSHLERGERTNFDREMRLAALFAPEAAATLRRRRRPFGTDDVSAFDLYQRARRFRLGDEVQQIRTPILVTGAQDERFWPGQSQQLYDRLPGPKRLLRLGGSGSSGVYDAPLAGALRDARVFDWLDGYLAR